MTVGWPSGSIYRIIKNARFWVRIIWNKLIIGRLWLLFAYMSVRSSVPHLKGWREAKKNLLKIVIATDGTVVWPRRSLTTPALLKLYFKKYLLSNFNFVLREQFQLLGEHLHSHLNPLEFLESRYLRPGLSDTFVMNLAYFQVQI